MICGRSCWSAKEAVECIVQHGVTALHLGWIIPLTSISRETDVISRPEPTTHGIFDSRLTQCHLRSTLSAQHMPKCCLSVRPIVENVALLCSRVFVPRLVFRQSWIWHHFARACRHRFWRILLGVDGRVRRSNRRRNMWRVWACIARNEGQQQQRDTYNTCKSSCMYPGT